MFRSNSSAFAHLGAYSSLYNFYHRPVEGVGNLEPGHFKGEMYYQTNLFHLLPILDRSLILIRKNPFVSRTWTVTCNAIFLPIFYAPKYFNPLKEILNWTRIVYILMSFEYYENICLINPPLRQGHLSNSLYGLCNSPPLPWGEGRGR